uniref:Uncharacterized protein n=1 Tax=Anguilla anguilla TaxID=7936 RepID=A0A0E9VHQ5_ANGAN
MSTQYFYSDGVKYRDYNLKNANWLWFHTVLCIYLNKVRQGFNSRAILCDIKFT